MKSIDCSFLHVISVILFSFLSILIPVSIAIISIQDYCDSFPDTLKPVICILKEQKNLQSSTSRPSTTRKPGYGWTSPGEGWGGWGEESESESEEDSSSQCNCDLTCYPPSSASGSGMTTSSEEDTNLKCKPCGNHCDVTMATNPKCSCASLGSGLAPKKRTLFDLSQSGLDPALDMELLEGGLELESESESEIKSLLSPLLIMEEQEQDRARTSSSRSSKCSCTVTCAQTAAMNEIPFCIFNITELQTSRDRRPVNCECCKSKAAENTDYPDFVCVCQRL